MTDRLTGKLYTTPLGRASYEISDAESPYVFTVLEVLQNRFGFDDVGLPRMGLGEVTVQCRRSADTDRHEAVLVVGWDNWSGCYVMSVNAADDALVAEFGRHMDERVLR
jgi:hypothetical protein